MKNTPANYIKFQNLIIRFNLKDVLEITPNLYRFSCYDEICYIELYKFKVKADDNPNWTGKVITELQRLEDEYFEIQRLIQYEIEHSAD